MTHTRTTGMAGLITPAARNPGTRRIHISVAESLNSLPTHKNQLIQDRLNDFLSSYIRIGRDFGSDVVTSNLSPYLTSWAADRNVTVEEGMPYSTEFNSVDVFISVYDESHDKWSIPNAAPAFAQYASEIGGKASIQIALPSEPETITEPSSNTAVTLDSSLAVPVKPALLASASSDHLEDDLEESAA